MEIRDAPLICGRQRIYDSYEQYAVDQGMKLQASGGEAYTDPAKHIELFRQRFLPLLENGLPTGLRVLCLGARRGEEVWAWKALGFKAIGIDLNPGKNNPDVQVGDFHDLHRFDPGSFEVVYTNSFDHVYDWEKVVDEIQRVVTPCGWVILDLMYGWEEGGPSHGRDCFHWSTCAEMARLIAVRQWWTLHSVYDLQPYGAPKVKRAVLRADPM